MSVVSSRVSSVSSILKTSGVRTKFVKQPGKVYFKLPRDIKNILCNFANSDGIKEYEKLIHSLKECAVKDSDLTEFLTETRQCISLMDVRYESFVQVLLQIEWTNRSPEVISAYKFFLQDLVCMQTLHINIVINRLVELFKPEEDSNAEHEVGQFKSEDIDRLNHIHDILHKILEYVPMSDKVLLQSLVSRFPYIIHGTYTHEIYIHALLQILNYAPQLRSNILVFIINRLMMLDVNIPREEASNDEKDVVDDCIGSNGTADNDNPTEINNDANKRETIHPTARTLDSCMELFLKYMHEFCFANDVLQIENLRTLYFDVLCAFEAVILPTHASQYVQFIIFYICSFRSVITETFTKWLWHKVTDPNVAPVLRQTAICYISSLHATASFMSPGQVKIAMFDLTLWIHKYITSQEDVEYINDDVKPHVVFYSVCQAFFHLFVARYKHFVESKNGILFLQNLDISKIVTCKLNPLKMCDTKIVRDFADITSTYQLAYCFAVIEDNERNQLPIFGVKTHLPVLVSNFFPFESYTLEHSGHRITPFLRNNVANVNSRSVRECK
ncbi:PREDICTED: RNA polymerase I-specific transcription initiation factor RRN3 [Vollenhovia emeryi]|uniref:RNA polymerase I-specific transcription initiation factor RRN3 n=1 Tax=Vollenhovia emeryi TaxID=411798 RepID=UPI0005F45FC7|nr:PREDICTED: RNA polymerase I-specific transcription initiation factor RRN3 [Vollenhovia emeryi]